MNGERLAAGLVGRYRVEEQVGEGGAAVVFRARDLRHDRTVAIKVLRADVAADIGAERFLQEIRVAAGLTHPHILPVFDSGEAAGFLYYVMPAIEGRSLRDRLEREHQLPIEDALGICRQVASALDYAHRQKVVHRDIKPENILLHDGSALVADFGIAKVLGDGAGVTRTGIAIGTPAYMSPEQAFGESNLDARSDVFSLGCVLYEMLTGTLPFPGPTMQAMLAQRMLSTPPAASQVRKLPENVSQALSRALARDPAQRFESAAEFAKRLVAHGPPAGKARRKPGSIAVLPFHYADDDAGSLEYLADGLTENLIQHLSALPRLTVMARSTVFHFKASQLEPRAAGRELGVDAVVTGYVRRMGPHLVLGVELIATEDGARLWGARYEKEGTDVLWLQNTLAEEIITGLRVQVTGAARKRLARRPTEHPAAYEAYLRGRFHLEKRTQEALENAVQFFEAAIAVDGKYALAHAGLAEAYTLLGTAGYARAPVDVMGSARRAALRAVELDDQLAEAHTALGWLRFRFEWDWAAAERALRRAIALAPGSSRAHHWLALLLTARGDPAAIKTIDRALEGDPLSPVVNTARGRVLHFSRRYPEAEEQYRKTLALAPAFVGAHFDLGMTLAQMGALDEAIAAFERQDAALAERPIMRAVLANFYAQAGRIDDARRIVAELHQLPGAAVTAGFDLAIALVGLGEYDEALASLERGLMVRNSPIVFLKVEPLFDSLRNHPRFQAILGNLGLH